LSSKQFNDAQIEGWWPFKGANRKN